MLFRSGGGGAPASPAPPALAGGGATSTASLSVWDSPAKNTAVGCHFLLQSMKVKSESEVAQSCSTLSDPMDCSLPGFSVHGIFQARIMEWGAIACAKLNEQGDNIQPCCCYVTSVMSDSVQPHRQEPTRLPHPWDSPGKNTGVGCHFLLQCMKVKSESEVAQLCPTLRDPMDCSLPGSSIHGIFQARVLEWGAITFSDDESIYRSNSLTFRFSCKPHHQDPPSAIV